MTYFLSDSQLGWCPDAEDHAATVTTYTPGEVWAIRVLPDDPEDLFLIQEDGLASALGARGALGQINPHWAHQSRKIELED